MPLILLVGALSGIAAGVGASTFVYAKGFSYLRNDPEVCANCHVMQQHYDAWAKGGHHHVAVCNDCHAPHNLIGKYATKGINGFNHTFAFTTGLFHDPIRIKSMNRAITEQACRNCHQDLTETIDHQQSKGQRLECLKCHSTVGHDQ